MAEENIKINNLKTNAKARDKKTCEMFEFIKDYTGLNSDTEVTRFCINSFYRYLKSKQ